MKLLWSFLVMFMYLAYATTTLDDDIAAVEAQLRQQKETLIENIRQQLDLAKNDRVAKDQLERTEKAIVTELQKSETDPPKKKADLSKLVDTISKVNTNLRQLQSSDINVKMKAICEVTATLALVIPPPAGTAISAVAMIGAVVFGMHIEEDEVNTPSIKSVVSELLDEQYKLAIGHELLGEAERIRVQILDFGVAYDRELNTSLACQNSTEPYKNKDGSIMTHEERKTHCDRTAVSRRNEELMLDTMHDSKHLGIAERESTLSAIKDSLCHLKSLAQMHQIRNLFRILARLRSLRFVMFTKMKLYTDAFLHDATHPYNVEEKYRVEGAKNFGKWVDKNLGNGTSCTMAAVFALYLLRNPVEGMDVLTDRIGVTMEHVLRDLEREGGGPHFTLQVKYDDSWTNVGHFNHCETLLTVGECRSELRYCRREMETSEKVEFYRRNGVWARTQGYKQIEPCYDGSTVLRLKRYSSDIKDGFIISQDSNPSWSWGPNNSTYVRGPNSTVLAAQYKASDLSAFAFHPIKLADNSTIYMFMLTIRNGVRPKVFSFMWSSNKFKPHTGYQHQLAVDDVEFQWFDKVSHEYGMFFKFLPV